MSSPHSGPGSMPGLDADNNPDLDNLTGPRNSPIKRSQPLRDVDWRDGPQALNTGTKFRAAHGQRCGMVAPEDQECRQCGRENGTFASCVVNVVDDELQFGARYIGTTLPDWVLDYARTKNPSFEPSVNREDSPSPEKLRSRPDRAPFNTPSAGCISSSPAPGTVESPFSPYSTGMNSSLAAEWYSSPLDHLELQGNLESMQQIRRELLTARQRVDQDIAWLTAEIQKQTRNTALVDLLTKVMHS
ncbi:hypothetical protein N7492_004897 [Penicillium capsulatum]|uniref:Uncharacterized protein n=1 Tax=Penicillium capsulatum TaxID=69766 RepID=A0A9W9I8G7_9EURO|nr:hypothetical protein N7492_004897 [Penicillium capsulatum]